MIFYGNMFGRLNEGMPPEAWIKERLEYVKKDAASGSREKENQKGEPERSAECGNKSR